MSVNDELIQPSSDSFWEVGQYKRTSKRVEDGHKLCDELMNLIRERAEIEKNYAKSLKGWSKRWHDFIDKGPEYGTTEASWRGVLTEAERVSELHIQVKDRLMNEVHTNIKQWQKEHYHKSVMGPSKEFKDLDDQFRKAQKPWAKKLEKVIKCKKDYHTACKLERTASHQENNAKGDSSVSPDQVKKIQDKLDKCRRDVESTKDRYQAALNDLNAYNAKYMEDMSEVFEKCQETEERRLQYFKEMLYGIHACLDISNDPSFAQIYHDLTNTISNADHTKDLKWWSNNHGVDMAMNWPHFEEYSPELAAISKKGKAHITSSHGDGTGITLTAISKSTDYVPPASATDTSTHYSKPSYTTQQSNSSDNTPYSAPNSAPASGGGGHTNPFGDDDWEEDEDDGGDGTPVRALYDYEGQEADELSFKAGDVFSKLSDEDEQGWCKGRKDSRRGLYPANYVEVI